MILTTYTFHSKEPMFQITSLIIIRYFKYFDW